MFDKIIAFFMSIIAFFASLFGINISDGYNAFENVSYGDHSRQVLDLYLPEENDGTAGLILLIHGGAWIEGDKSSYTAAAKDIAKKYGFAAATINYRYLSDDVDMNDILDDIEAAVAKISALGEENGVRIEKMLLSGHSAGAHLSMLYAYSRTENSAVAPVAVVDYSGPTDLTDEEYLTNAISGIVFQLLSYATGESINNAEDAQAYRNEILAFSPVSYADTAVPTIIAHGAKDSVVPYQNAVDLDAALTLAGVKHDFVTYSNSDHDLAADDDCEEKVYTLMLEYAYEYLE